MDSKTLEALRQSIAHWKRLATGKRRPQEGMHGGSCALCALFVLGRSLNEACIGCPVHQKTRSIHCYGSPWFKALDASEFGFDSPEFKAAALKELEFLESLLPEAGGK